MPVPILENKCFFNRATPLSTNMPREHTEETRKAAKDVLESKKPVLLESFPVLCDCGREREAVLRPESKKNHHSEKKAVQELIVIVSSSEGNSDGPCASLFNEIRYPFIRDPAHVKKDGYVFWNGVPIVDDFYPSRVELGKGGKTQPSNSIDFGDRALIKRFLALHNAQSLPLDDESLPSDEEGSKKRYKSNGRQPASQ